MTKSDSKQRRIRNTKRICFLVVKVRQVPTTDVNHRLSSAIDLLLKTAATSAAVSLEAETQSEPGEPARDCPATNIETSGDEYQD